MTDNELKILKLYVDMVNDVLETAIKAIEGMNIADSLCIAGALKSTRVPIEKIQELINAEN